MLVLTNEAGMTNLKGPLASGPFEINISFPQIKGVL